MLLRALEKLCNGFISILQLHLPEVYRCCNAKTEALLPGAHHACIFRWFGDAGLAGLSATASQICESCIRDLSMRSVHENLSCCIHLFVSIGQVMHLAEVSTEWPQQGAAYINPIAGSPGLSSARLDFTALALVDPASRCGNAEHHWWADPANPALKGA